MQDVRAKFILFIYFHQLRHCVKASIARSTLFALRHHSSKIYSEAYGINA